MNKKQIAYILKYSHPKQLYIVTYKNSLLQLNCPFKVILRNDIGGLKKDQIVFIEEVKVTVELVTVFIVNSEAYFYYHFDILID